MPRNRRDADSSGPTILNVLWVMLLIGLGVTVVVLRAQRRAERREAVFGRSDDPPAATAPVNPAPHAAQNNFPQNPRPQTPVPVVPANPAPPAFVPHNPLPALVTPPAGPEPKRLPPGVRQLEPVGGAFANIPYREGPAEGGVLIGFEVGYIKFFDAPIIGYLRPIWLTSKGEVPGTAYGRSLTPTVVVKARPGYAVGGMAIGGGGGLDGFAITFMKIGPKQLDPNDAYTNDWYGNPGHRPAGSLRRGDGEFIIGLHGKRFEDKGGTNFDDGGGIGSLGLILWVKE